MFLYRPFKNDILIVQSFKLGEVDPIQFKSSNTQVLILRINISLFPAHIVCGIIQRKTELLMILMKIH